MSQEMFESENRETQKTQIWDVGLALESKL